MNQGVLARRWVKSATLASIKLKESWFLVGFELERFIYAKRMAYEFFFIDFKFSSELDKSEAIKHP